jgi:hypothetical protein
VQLPLELADDQFALPLVHVYGRRQKRGLVIVLPGRRAQGRDVLG